MDEIKDHNLVENYNYDSILVERKTLLDDKGHVVEGLYNFWISLNNPKQYNSYTTKAVKEIILAFREASCDRSIVSVVFTGVEDKAFCTGGNTKEYAEYYAGNPAEYKQYMRLFNDMVTAIMVCDKPVINRVNGMRIGGGQEIGMACDFSLSSDMAKFGQAGPKHGSAPDGGSTDFLHLYVGFTQDMESCTICTPWSAHKALQLGLINKIAPILKNKAGNFISNPFITTKMHDEWGNLSYGDFKTGTEKEEASKLIKECSTDFSILDSMVNDFSYSLAMTMPGCLMKTIESVRKKKLEHWNLNCETNRSWLALNMMTEGRAGFRAFNEGVGKNREADFLMLRRSLAKATPWSDKLTEEILPH